MGSAGEASAERGVARALATLLRTGVILAAAIVVIGGAVYLARHGGERPHYGVFRGEPSDLRSLAGILGDAAAASGRGLIQLGLVVLIATPVGRVAFAAAAFALQRDRTYVVVTLAVLGLLLLSLTGHTP
jgi:uncharacterized membrane protein